MEPPTIKILQKKNEDRPAPEDMEWIRVHHDLNEAYNMESMWQKQKRRMTDNPFIPIGCLATVCALSYGLFNFYHGRRQMQQYMMRARIGAQGFTIAVFVIGIVYQKFKPLTP